MVELIIPPVLGLIGLVSSKKKIIKIIKTSSATGFLSSLIGLYWFMSQLIFYFSPNRYLGLVLGLIGQSGPVQRNIGFIIWFAT